MLRLRARRSACAPAHERAEAERLVAEAETNVALRVLQQVGGGGDRFEVQGRGELHLGVLIETMRRENFELSVSPPAVLYKPDPDRPGKRLEPLEEVLAEVDEEHVGGVIEALSLRKGELIDMQHGAGEGGKTRLEFLFHSRGIIGFRAVFDTETTHLSKKTPPAGATDMYSCPCTAAWTSAPSVTSLPRGAGHTDGETSGSAISVVRQYQRKFSSSCNRKQFFSSQSFSAGVMDVSFKLKSFVQTTSATL